MVGRLSGWGTYGAEGADAADAADAAEGGAAAGAAGVPIDPVSAIALGVGQLATGAGSIAQAIAAPKMQREVSRTELMRALATKQASDAAKQQQVIWLTLGLGALIVTAFGLIVIARK